MSHINRRTFLQGALATAATVTIAGTKSSGRVLGANETIRVGVAGLHGRGSSHVGAFSGMKGVQVTYLIDPDSRTFKARAATVEKNGGNRPTTVADVRKALDDKNLDAISIATPNHWHALMTIWACQAGKDVYVEKPCSHNVHEGRLAVEAARKNNRIVQHGTQSRSSGSWARVAALAKSGKLGKLLVSRGLCYKPRGSIGFKKPEMPPAEVDFNLWLGPAQEHPYHGNLVHYNWHWFWDFGNGDIGNQGVHQMDIARWIIPGATLPKSVIGLGGRFGYDDQGQTPNTQVAVMDYGDTQLIFEVRGLVDKDRRITNIAHFEEGRVEDGKLYRKGKDKPEALPSVEAEPRGPGGDHFGNFIAAVRSRKVEDLNADIEEGHLSSALCHLANISYRLGEETAFDQKRRVFKDNAFATETVQKMEEHLREKGVKLEGEKVRVGPRLEFDPSGERFRDNESANKLLTRNYRAPFVPGGLT